MRGCPMKVVFLVVIMLWSLSAVAQVPPGNSVDLPAFRVVIPGQVYRGGAPTAQGIRQLAQHGIKTIVDLRLWFPSIHFSLRRIRRLAISKTNCSAIRPCGLSLCTVTTVRIAQVW